MSNSKFYRVFDNYRFVVAYYPSEGDKLFGRDYATINWSCCGEVPIKDAKEFRDALDSAIRDAEEWEGKRDE